MRTEEDADVAALITADADATIAADVITDVDVTTDVAITTLLSDFIKRGG